MSKRDELLKDDLNSITTKYRLLEVLYQDHQPKELFGKLKIVDKEGVFHGSFEILVPIPEKYPFAFPSLAAKGNLKSATSRVFEYLN